MPSSAFIAPSAPFQLDWSAQRPIARWLHALITPLLSRILALDQLNETHARITSLGRDDSFSGRALRSLRIDTNVDESALQTVPQTGPLVVVANHPFGGIDGLALLALTQRRRPDVKILANHILRRIPELAEHAFFVDPFGGADATRKNLASIRAALRWVKDGHALAVFPAGEVSSLALRAREIQDIAWNPTIAGLARAARASVLPIYFSGRNSTAFQLAGLFSPRLRTILLPRELLRKRGSRIEVQIGSLIPPARLDQFDSDEELSSYLRVRTYLLAGRASGRGARHVRSPQKREDQIAPAESPQIIAAELEALPAAQHLATNGSLHVSYARAEQIPTTLREIGRLREITFRRAGEGTGRSADLDRFDEYYLHLLVHDSARRQVVGAYRLGLTDHILPAHGKDGLYTHTLFRFSDELLNQIGPAIELGRSFVRPEYQKEFAPLMLLWRGIALFAARYPQYRRLFGPVSISNEYQSLTRQLLIEFLKINASSSDLHKLVSARNPPRFGPGRNWPARLAGTIVRTIEGIDELIGEIESDRRGSPVLLRQYLKLNAKLLGFNVDPDFGDVLDGLMLVDLTQVQRAILVRYMGRENATRFLAYHGIS